MARARTLITDFDVAEGNRYPIVEVIGDGKDLRILGDGKLVARRKWKGTPQDKEWIILAPGWEVTGGPDQAPFRVRYVEPLWKHDA